MRRKKNIIIRNIPDYHEVEEDITCLSNFILNFNDRFGFSRGVAYAHGGKGIYVYQTKTAYVMVYGLSEKECA